MSKRLVNLVYAKTCGGQTRKAVLVAMADRANDDGSGVWVSKTRLAAEVEVTRQTIFQVIRDLVEAEILSDRGKRNGKRGYTIQYDLNVKAIKKFPDSWPDSEDYEVCEDDQPIVSSEATLSPPIVSNGRADSVSVNSTSRPYRTIDKNSNFSENKKPVAQTVRTSAFALWEANRFRSSDPERARELEAEAEALAVAELAAERGDHSKQKSSKKRGSENV